MEQGTDTRRSTPSSERSGTPLPPLIIEPYNIKEREAEEERFYDELVRKMHVVYMRYYLEKQERTKALEKKYKEISEEQVEGANENNEIFDFYIFEPVGDNENDETVHKESVEGSENEEIFDEESVGDSNNEEIVDEEGGAVIKKEEVADLETEGESDNKEADDMESKEDKEESADTEDDGDDQEGTSTEFDIGGIMNIPVQAMIHRDPESDDEDTEDSEAAVEEGSAHEDTQDTGVIDEPMVAAHSPTEMKVKREDKLVAHSEDDKNIEIHDEDTLDDDAEADEEDREARIERHIQHTPGKEAAASKKSTLEPELEQMRTPRYSLRQSLLSVIQKERNQKRITHEDRRRERYDSFSSISDVAADDTVRETPELFLGQEISYASDIVNVSRRKRQAPSVIEGHKTKRLKTLAPFRTQLQNKSFFIGEQVVYSLCRCENHVCNYSKKK
ncbi:hypothetical protein K1T71_014356 [Dendrolimus kikuchii]|uniref:Uncharacterized protein n=1 Tax=Dendrolimus kikuchii TaxID=765133 RepID=A0ACC1CE26_9NEOP|nr:hypothetical protein K1T71_014356 [Dendrolimus kikuchii]